MRQGRLARARRPHLWPWLSVTPLGLGAWAPIIAAWRCRVWWWAGLGIVPFGLALSGLALAGRHHGHDPAAGGLTLLGWIGGILASFGVRGSYERRIGGEAPTRSTRVPWPVPTARSRSWTARYALTAYVATFAAAAALGVLLRYGIGIHIELGLGGILTEVFLVAGLVPLARRSGLSRQDLGLRLTRGPASLGYVVAGFVLYVGIAVVWTAAFDLHTPARAVLGRQTPDPLNTVLDVVALSLTAPVVEEVFFRGLLYRSLRNRLAIAPAALIAGCLFGLVHVIGYPLISLPIKAAFGVIACLLYERTGSLLPGIALHSFVDASSADVLFTGNDWIVLASSAGLGLLVLITALVRGAGAQRRPVAEDALSGVADAEEVEAVGSDGPTGG